jgi:formylglycine-generating enzyme required for sulfatase activity
MYNNLLFINSVLYYHINKNLKLLVIALAIGHQSASAQITENFIWPLNSFSMEFVRVANPGNLPNTTKDYIYHAAPAYTDLIQGGAVGYTYDIAKTEVSRIMVEKVNAESFDQITMQDLSGLGGNGPNRPATGLSWYDAAKFVNELNLAQGKGIAYKTTGYTVPILSEWQPGEVGYNAANPLRNSTAKYFIASSDEWYKAAFYSPTKAAYNFFPQPDVDITLPPPTPVAGGTVGAVYGQTGPADVNNAGGSSAYGTVGQGGNAYEWTESGGRVEGGWWGSEISTNDFDYTGGYQTQTINNTPVVVYVNGDWVPYYARDLDYYVAQEETDSLQQMGGLVLDLNDKTYATGFRVVSVNVPLTGGIPEPSALSLLAVGLGGLAMIRRRRS